MSEKVNLGRVAYVEKGAYDGGTTYQKKDVVSYNNGSYVYIADVSAAGIVPTDTAYWQPMINPEAMNRAAEAANKAAEAATAAVPNLRKELDGKAPAILVDASGDMVHITDGAEGIPVQSLITHVEPVEIGEGEKSPANPWTIIGWEEVSVTGARRNLLYHSSEKVEDMTLKNSSGADISRKGYLVEIPAGDYVIKSEYKEGYTTGTYITGLIVDAGLQNHGKESIKVVNGNTVGTYKFSIEPGEKLALYNGNTSLTVSQTKTAFDKVNLYLFVDDGNTENEEYNGVTLTAALPETLYGFDINWTTGLVTVTHKRSLLNGNFTKVSTSVSGYCCGNVAIADMMPESVNKGYCDMLTPVERPYASYVNGASIVFGFPSAPKTIYAFIPETLIAENTLDAINAYFAANPATIVYPLAEPYTIQLTPQQMETLKGTNNIWSNAGETAVTYAADTKLYIDGKIAAIAAAIV